MGVQVYLGFALQGLLQGLHKAVGLVGQQQVRHVLDADVVRAHLLQLERQVHKVLLGVHGAEGVAQGHLADAAVLLGGLDGRLQVAGIVQGIEDADDVDAVLDGQAGELIHHVVGVVAIAQYVLAAEQHLQLGVGQGFLQLAQAHPGILVQEAQAAVERRAAPALQGIIANLVQHLAGGQHVLGAHAGRSLGLVRVAKDGLGNHYFSHLELLRIMK